MMNSLVNDEATNALGEVLVEYVEGPPKPNGEQAFVRAALFAKKGRKKAGSIILCPGRTEYIEKYAFVIAQLQKRGFVVLVIDPRGQGDSTRLWENHQAGHMDSFENAAIHLGAAVKHFEDNLPKPRILLAHSMGGAIGLQALIAKNLEAHKAVFTAPMWGIKTIPFAKQITKAMIALKKDTQFAVTAPKYWTPEAFEGNPVTHDETQHRRNNALLLKAPNLQIAGVTNGWANAAFEIMDSFTPEKLSEIKIPILIESAEADTIVDTDSHFRIGGQLANAKVNSIFGAKHEILMEREDFQQKFWKDFDEFVS